MATALEDSTSSPTLTENTEKDTLPVEVQNVRAPEPHSILETPSIEAGTETGSSLVKFCGVCKENEAKYKCSLCYLPYCSVACSRVHKATHPTSDYIPKPTSNGAALLPPDKDIPRAGTVAAAGFKGPFAALDDSKELKLLFQTYPNLPSQLDEINTATLPPMDDQKSMLNHTARHKGGKSESWNHDRGLEDGVEALRRARAAEGKDGEGIKEYSKLVLQILSGDAGIQAAEMIQKEIADENARIISMLLSHETR